MVARQPTNSDQWREVGRHAARRGYAVTSVLTDETHINALIREGYAEGQQQAAERQQQAADAAAEAEIRSQLGRK